ncbi:integral membrane protein [Streptomyces lividans 1326]|uniref:Integral membrane protein n=1 Tax=Streptomyces lividans 1326 TaxID=1200984 RepID=A0A7U9HBJ8_STRLI|nr:integral membrane protein [Streptomyces lividans 1326]
MGQPRLHGAHHGPGHGGGTAAGRGRTAPAAGRGRADGRGAGGRRAGRRGPAGVPRGRRAARPAGRRPVRHEQGGDGTHLAPLRPVAPRGLRVPHPAARLADGAGGTGAAREPPGGDRLVNTREGPAPCGAGPRHVLRDYRAAYCVVLRGNDVLRLRALLALRDVEVHPLALLELAEALGGDVRVVGEDVGAAAVLRDETEALFGVEPLHGTGSHAFFS